MHCTSGPAVKRGGWLPLWAWHGGYVGVLTLKIQGCPPKVNRNGFPRLGWKLANLGLTQVQKPQADSSGDVDPKRDLLGVRRGPSESPGWLIGHLRFWTPLTPPPPEILAMGEGPPPIPSPTCVASSWALGPFLPLTSSPRLPARAWGSMGGWGDCASGTLLFLALPIPRGTLRQDPLPKSPETGFLGFGGT